MSDEPSSKKGIIAAVLILAAGGLGYAQLKKTTPGPAINNGVTGDFDGGGDRQAEFARAARAAGVTPQQQKQIQAVREKGDWREMRTEMEKILKPEQQQKLREEMRLASENRRAERDAKMKSALGEADFKRYQEMRAERFRGGRGGGGRGPGGGWGGRPGGNSPQ